MRAKSIISLGLVLAVLSLAFVVGLNPVGAASTTTIKLAHVNAVTHAINMSSEKFKQLVEERSNGRIKVQIYPSSQLGNEKELAEGAKMGTVDMVHISSGGLANFLPKMGVFDAGYIFRDQKHQRNVLRGKIGKAMRDELVKKSGIRILQYYYQGERNLTTNRQVSKPADLKGMKIRTPDVKSYVETLRAMGAVPTPIAFNELFTALQLKLIDGQENPLPTIQAMKFYEVQKYVTLTGHMMAPGVLAMNDRLFKKFSSKDQKLIQQAADDAMDYHDATIVKQQEESLAELQKLGMTVVTPTEEALNEWRTMCKNSLPKVFSDVWPDGLYESIINTK